MYENEIKEIKNYMEQWLKVSNITMDKLLSYRTVSNFRVVYEVSEDNVYGIIKLGYIMENSFIQIGESIIYYIENEESKINSILLLFYIARRLDELNEKAPEFERRDNYFYNIVKEFCSKL